jgi:hypothetical protein
MTPGAPRSLSQACTPTVWAAVTVRVAWTLFMAGIRVRPATLADARDHVLLSLPSGTDPDEAEQRSGPLTVEFLARVAGESVRRIGETTDDLTMVHEGWRTGLVAALDPVGDAVFRLHYGDGMSISQVERTAAIGGAALAMAQNSLREMVRDMADRAGVSAQGWPDSKIDQLLNRIANTAEPGCAPPMDILSDHHRAHVDACPRCSRAVRMIRGGVVAPSDMVPPSADSQTNQESAVGAVVLHPDARRCRKKVSKVLGSGAVQAGPEVWLMSETELVAAGPGLKALVSGGILPRHHVRGAVVRGPGRWSGAVLLGPVAVDAIEAARARPWSEIDSLGELPPPRPAPPSPVRWWIGAGLVALGAIGMGATVLGPQTVVPDVPVEAQFVLAEDGWEITFDADDLAVIDIVSVTPDGPTVVHHNIRSDRGQWATGDGKYRVYVPDKIVALLASENGIADLDEMVLRSRAQPTPMETLESWVLAAHPKVAWVGSPAIAVQEATDGYRVGEPTLEQH